MYGSLAAPLSSCRRWPRACTLILHGVLIPCWDQLMSCEGIVVVALWEQVVVQVQQE